MKEKSPLETKSITSGRYPIHDAVAFELETVLQALIDAGADVNVKDKEQLTPIHHAARFDVKIALEPLIQGGASIVDGDGKHDSPPLAWAAQAGHVEVVTELLARGAPVNAKSRDQSTPLYFASGNGHTEIVTILLAAGEEIDAKGPKEETPLHYAAYNNHPDVIRILTDAGADKEAVNSDGATPLLFATTHEKTEGAIALITAGANTEAVDTHERTPLLIASQAGNVAIVRALVDADANTEVVDRCGLTPLLLASEAGDTALVTILVETGANKEVVDRGGKTPLHWATFCHHVETTIVLLNAREDCSDAVDLGSMNISQICQVLEGTTKPLKFKLGASSEGSIMELVSTIEQQSVEITCEVPEEQMKDYCIALIHNASFFQANELIHKIDKSEYGDILKEMRTIPTPVVTMKQVNHHALLHKLMMQAPNWGQDPSYLAHASSCCSNEALQYIQATLATKKLSPEFKDAIRHRIEYLNTFSEEPDMDKIDLLNSLLPKGEKVEIKATPTEELFKDAFTQTEAEDEAGPAIAGAAQEMDGE